MTIALEKRAHISLFSTCCRRATFSLVIWFSSDLLVSPPTDSNQLRPLYEWQCPGSAPRAPICKNGENYSLVSQPVCPQNATESINRTDQMFTDLYCVFTCNAGNIIGLPYHVYTRIRCFGRPRRGSFPQNLMSNDNSKVFMTVYIEDRLR